MDVLYINLLLNYGGETSSKTEWIYFKLAENIESILDPSFCEANLRLEFFDFNQDFDRVKKN